MKSKKLYLMSIFAVLLISTVLFAQPSGSEVWIRHFGVGLTHAVATAVDPLGNVLVLGEKADPGQSSEMVLLKYAADGTELWNVTDVGSNAGFDDVGGLMVDQEGNVIVAGTIEVNGDWTDFIVLKFSSTGVKLWERRYDGPGHYDDDVSDVALDSEGNVIVVGSTMSEGWFAYPSFTTIKYNAQGALQWLKTFSATSHNMSSAEAVTIDPTGAIVVTGMCSKSGGNSDVLTIKYNPAGQVIWQAIFSGSANGSDFGVDVATDPTGNTFVAANSMGSGTSGDIILIKYDAAGKEEYVQRFNGVENLQDDVAEIRVDEYGSVYVVGTAANNLYSPNSDFVTLKYSNLGTLEWEHRYNGPKQGWDRANGLALDALGNVYVVGQSDGVDSASDFVIICYDAAGEISWVSRHSSAYKKDDSADDVVVDPQGNIIVVGTSGMTLDEAQITTIKYQGVDDANPVELVSFTATPNGQAMVLQWQTATESSNYGFQVLRSESPSARSAQWTLLGFVAGHGTTTQTNDYSFIDPAPPAKGFLHYRLKQIDLDGTFSLSQVLRVSLDIPQNFSLVPNYPNPFNATTTFSFSLPEDGDVRLMIYNPLGDRIATLVEEWRKAGWHQVVWRASEQSSGVYFYQLTFGNETITDKLLLLK